MTEAGTLHLFKDGRCWTKLVSGYLTSIAQRACIVFGFNRFRVWIYFSFNQIDEFIIIIIYRVAIQLNAIVTLKKKY